MGQSLVGYIGVRKNRLVCKMDQSNWRDDQS